MIFSILHFDASGIRFEASGISIRVSRTCFRDSGGFRVHFMFRRLAVGPNIDLLDPVSGFGFRVLSGFGIRVSISEISVFGFRVLGFSAGVGV